ncbi:hypothetical protein CWI38_0001p0010 [Hamiltosporidium tvaerminnensis]|uniref:Uncharacterized protein n=1 Tax=Hamiltosporidium tvaerminnensis TaxID=1176355 RepID=A0A4Q9M2M3_9MICR|nr:hypothetical protein CWI38_0001p0010 [Hamiltosporidium tvaerminnensis]
MNFKLSLRCIDLFYCLLNFYILLFMSYSAERDVTFNVLSSHEELCSSSSVVDTDFECLCRLKRDSVCIKKEVEYIQKLLIRDENKNYIKYVIKDLEKINLNFILFTKLNDNNSNIEIFLCNHIKNSEFIIFYEFLKSNALPDEKMTVDRFYTILYFLEYFRVEYDDRLRNILRLSLSNLEKSTDIENLDIEKISFHFTKQEYFSRKLFKKISQEYFRMLESENEVDISFLKIRKSNSYQRYEGLYTDDREHILIIDETLDRFLSEKVNMNETKKNLFILVLNTLDIKYLHIPNLKESVHKTCCLILQNIKKKIDEIIFIKVTVCDQIIGFLNMNKNFVNLKKLVFIETSLKTSVSLSEHLNVINEIIFNENYLKQKQDEVSDSNDLLCHNITEHIIENLNSGCPKASLEEFIRNREISEENKDLIFKLYNDNVFKNKVKVFEAVDSICKNYIVLCFYEYGGDYKFISITLRRNLNLKQFTIKDTILEKNIYEIHIRDCTITSNFINDILSITSLKKLIIQECEFHIEEPINIRNASIEYFRFWCFDKSDFCRFYEILNMMTNLKKVRVELSEKFVLQFFLAPKLSFQKLVIYNIDSIIDFAAEYNGEILSRFIKSSNIVLVGENERYSLQCLVQVFDLSLLDILTLENYSIYKSDKCALEKLSNLKQLSLTKINFDDISFQELFSTSIEYNIKKLYFEGINIYEADLKFIANLKKLKSLIFEQCTIVEWTSSKRIEMLFLDKSTIKFTFYIENLSTEKIMKCIRQVFAPKKILIFLIEEPYDIY